MLMVKFLKRSTSVLLSVLVIMFKGSACFGMDGDEENPPLPPSVALLPSGEDESITRSYAARRIYNADVGRSIENSDHSKVIVPTQDFFLYPPRSVKELFEVKDKQKAYVHGDSIMHTDAARRVNGSTRYDRITCECGMRSVQSFLSVFIFVGATIAWYLTASDWGEKTPEFKDFFKDCTDILYFFVFLASLVMFGSSCKGFYDLCSKACCDCYVCKPSDAGCSCGYGCGSGGDGCVGCVNCCDCSTENCCLKCCPCDNGGFALDFCGRYGVGSCCGKLYEEFSDDSVKDVEYFKRFIDKIDESKLVEKMMNKSDAISYFRNILRSASLSFEKYGRNLYSIESSGYTGTAQQGIGTNQADGYLLVPAGVYKLLKEDVFPPKQETLDGDVALKSLWSSLTESYPYRQTANTLGEFVQQFCNIICGGHSPIKEVDQFIKVIDTLCDHVLGETAQLDSFAKVRLQNYFNFIKALWEKRFKS